MVEKYGIVVVLNNHMKDKKSYTIDSYFIDRSNPAWSSCDSICWDAKNLYNYANYLVRQNYFNNKDVKKKYLNYYHIQKTLQANKSACYTKLNSKLAQAVLKELDKNWIGYFRSKEAYWKDKSKFNKEPKPPKYKNTKSGRKSVNFNIQTISSKFLKKDLLKLASLNFLIKLRLIETVDEDGVVTYHQKPNLREVSIIPKNDGYQIILKYLDTEPKVSVAEGYKAGMDLGLNNLAAIATNNKNAPSFLVNGKPLKAMNAYYNKHLAKLMSELALNKTKRGKKRIKNQIDKLSRKRHFKVKHYLHEVTKMIVTQLASANVTHLVVGKNDGWKQEINIGKVNNQNFVYIPHARFIDMLKYKWIKSGRTFEVTEESYTSKCSFLDKEEIGFHESYLGKRMKRGLFVTNQGHLINADVNGGANILRKVTKEAWSDWTEKDLVQGFVVSPRRLTTSLLR